MALDSFVAGHHVETLERFAYLCQLTTNAVSDRLIQTASRSKSARGSAKSADYIDSAAFVKAWGPRGIIIWRCVHESLVLRLNKLWNSTPARDTYIGAVTKISYQVLENPLLSKGTDLKQRAFHCIGRCVQYYSHTFTAKTTIIQNLQHYDDLSDTMAELLVACYNDFEAHQLADEVLREIGNRDFNGAQDKNSPKSFGRFLVHLSELCPKVVLKHMGILVRFLDSELPSVRSAIIEVIGNLILYLSGLEATNMQRHQITEYFELLEQRFRDNNFACRSKVLQVCIRLTEGSAKFPKQRPRLIDLIISRFEDKTSYVRKLAIKALTAFLLTHPFALDGGPLVQEELATKLRDVQEQMQAIASLQDVAAMALKRNPEVTVASPSPSPDEGVELDESEDSMELDEGTPAPTPSAEVEEPVLPGISEETLALFTQLQLQQRYYKDALRFVYQLSDAIPTLCQLLGSTHKAEVMESMDFFVAAYHYKIDRAVEGVRKMVHLIWIKDNTAGDEAKGVKTKLIDCYSKIYIPPRGGELSDREVTSQTVRNLIGLTNHATLAELTSLEELLGCMMHDDLITADVIAKLWSVYSYTKDDLPRHQRQGAIIILGMLAKAKRDLVANSVDALLRVGLGRLGRADLVLAKYTCIALQCLGSSGKRDKIPKAGEGADKQRSTRFPRFHPIFTQIRSIILDPIESDEWFPLAEQAVNAIYALSEQPDVVCTEIIREKTREVLQLTTPRTPEPASTPAPDSTDVEGEEGMAVDKEGEEASAVTTPPEAQPVAFSQRSGATTMVRSSYPLCQLLFLAGHVAIKQIVLLEIIEAELKRRRGSDSTATKTPSGGKGGGKAAASEEDELEQVTGTTEDEVADTIQHIRERELLYGPTSLLAVYGHMAAHVCSNPQVYADTVLQTHAALALSKMMCVSSLFCETQLPLLVRILTHSQLPTIRSNIIIALGDLTVCFNNLIGENVGYLYGPLHDSDKAVKKNTLMVLTHLILNGMIKVKGQLGEMAKCLEDPDRRISDLAKLFFTELASKDSYLYNNLPDMISTLSTGANAVSEDAFARIMKFIFEFINKDRQTENIVEKLCQRFRTSRQWRDIAYCLASVPYRTERTFKKLVDAFPLYSDKLGDDAVHQCMLDIISKLRLQGSQRPETRALIKPLLDEFEAKVKEARIRCAGEPDTTAKPRGGGGSTRISAVATPLNRNRRNQIVESSEDDGEEEEDDGEEEEEAEEESDDEEMDDISDDDL
ncbi:non-SMC mitotic condensation complex subunit 1-domain-containing protein [Dimargaris cristalligena]|uniref:Condensin complex subunit 1 n=1 Tax=Dimargaris cristalligena TaxID=215637 RepID=A0A4V1J4A6_9FUNG|nr:non-SMC mitotic condensation complex subunit 1-domain-containing protein [Dimargaris cristalligena]|eukprot:RKP34889.1 non-SMC mitotic condensation complex subunit 1-domain-containing protein [Dimargaris cristalligena]